MAERKVTRIEVQKKRKDRFSVFLDDEFGFGVSGEILAKCRITEGSLLSDREIQRILDLEERRRAKLQAFRYLAIRDHSEKELAAKLQQKGFAEPLVNRLLEELKEKKLLDDSLYAFRFARDRLLSRPIGKRQLTIELKKKGIQDELIEEVVETVYSEVDEAELARNLAEKKLKNLKAESTRKKKEKIAQFLSRRGFSWEIIQTVFTEIDLTTEDTIMD